MKGSDLRLIKTGQIRFTKKAAEVAKTYFKKKKAEDFLKAVKKGEDKPSGYYGFYEQLLGKKQDSSSECKVYTNDFSNSIKMFETLLIKEGNLNLMAYLSANSLLYITKGEQAKYKEMKLPETYWPISVVDEGNKSSMTKFIAEMKNTIDLSDLLLEIKE